MNRYRSAICLALTALAVVLFVGPVTAGEANCPICVAVPVASTTTASV